MNDEMLIVFGFLLAMALIISGSILGYNGMMAAKGLKSVPVCESYGTVWVGGGVVEGPIKNAQQ